MADDNIFQQYLRPPKSVLEYADEYDQADARKQTLQQNALTLAAGQQKQDDYTRERGADNALSRLVSSGQTPDQVAVGLAQAGYGKHALAYTKQQQELANAKATNEHLTAQTGKLTAEKDGLAYKQREEKRQKSIQDIAAFTDPQQALVSLALHEQAGDIDPEQAALVRQTIPKNPADFPKWQVSMLQRIMSAKDAAGQIAPDANNIATNARIKSEGDANRAVTVSGQNKVDERARKAASQGRIPTGYRANQDGTLVFIPGGPADPKIVKGKPTEFEGKSAIFGARAEEADRILNSIDYRPAAVNSKRSLEGFPLIGGALSAAANKFSLTDSDQKAEQAQRDFVNAVLRQESGAAIAASEFDNAVKQYFPQPGDSVGVIAQKAKARKTTIQGLKKNAGNSAFTADSGVAKPSLNDIFK
ncbi:hypothetical protein [Janthinobacterium sp. PAMC25594]|uniref:hypothetical protein n=1 Tax=Janthinobacterium sp. PAMC25594 TaxID=2861284 RepID=UPI001C629529|nr:hypothetical protein [Janthinobacterium sp. PAMC25594]QYG07122.1 hypothetical protein KY494_28725 [Janthinobacterium sp. PAMC25594]